MMAQAVVYKEHQGLLYGDVPALFIAAAALAYLVPRKTS